MSGLRITDMAEVKRLVSRGLIKQCDAKAVETQLKVARKHTSKNAGILNLSSLIPVEPSHLLYQSIVRKFGRLYEGGEAVFELQCQFDRNYRIDVALPAYRLCIEMDGWQFHGKTLSGFQRDREKSLSFERRGWRVIRFSNKQVKDGLNDVIQAISEIASHCIYMPELKLNVRQIGFDRSEFKL